jgi:hypothetical protein
LAGLTWVKAKTLSGCGRVSRVRSGPGRVIGLRHFPYLGAVGLAGLGRVMVWKTGLMHFFSRASFSLIPQPGLR